MYGIKGHALRVSPSRNNYEKCGNMNKKWVVSVHPILPDFTDVFSVTSLHGDCQSEDVTQSKEYQQRKKLVSIFIYRVLPGSS